MKNKISIYLNMLIICLSLCVISIGVYSLTSANLTITGSLGYVYHDKSPYTITATIQNYTTTEDGTLQTSATSTPLTIGKAESNATAGSEITKISLTDKIYFKGTGYGSGNNIEILVTVKNNEDTQKAVVLLFDDITGLGYTRKVASGKVTTPTNITTNHSSAIILSKGEQTTFRLTLKQSIKKTNLSIAQADFNIQLSVANYVASNFTASQTDTTTTTDITYTLNTDLKSWSVTNSTKSGDVAFEPIVQGLPVNTINACLMHYTRNDRGYTLTIPNSVTDIESSIEDECVFYCYLPGSLININGAFGDVDGGRIKSSTENYIIFNIERMNSANFISFEFAEIEFQSDKLECIPTNFLWMSSISSITLPNNLKTIGSLSFLNCSALTAIYVPSSAVEDYKDALTGVISDTSIVQAIST